MASPAPLRPLRFRPWHHRRARVLRWLRVAVEHLPERDPARTHLAYALEQVSDAPARYATGAEFLAACDALRASGASVPWDDVDFDGEEDDL